MEIKKQESSLGRNSNSSSSHSISSGEGGSEAELVTSMNQSMGMNQSVEVYEEKEPPNEAIERKLDSLKLQIRGLIDKVNMNDSILAKKNLENEELKNIVMRLKQRAMVQNSLDNQNFGCCSNCTII